jgi:hypothetical protein
VLVIVQVIKYLELVSEAHLCILLLVNAFLLCKKPLTYLTIAQENLQVVEFLLGFDAYPNFKDEFGSTPLDLSITKKVN